MTRIKVKSLVWDEWNIRHIKKQVRILFITEKRIGTDIWLLEGLNRGRLL